MGHRAADLPTRDAPPLKVGKALPKAAQAAIGLLGHVINGFSDLLN